MTRIQQVYAPQATISHKKNLVIIMEAIEISSDKSPKTACMQQMKSIVNRQEVRVTAKNEKLLCLSRQLRVNIY